MTIHIEKPKDLKTELTFVRFHKTLAKVHFSMQVSKVAKPGVVDRFLSDRRSYILANIQNGIDLTGANIHRFE
jgi:hypothetical protein